MNQVTTMVRLRNTPCFRISAIVLTTLFISVILSVSTTWAAENYDNLRIRGTAHMAGTSGDTAYYAVGIDGGGPLYKYNAKTGKSRMIASGKWLWLNEKGKYLYLTKNDYYGSDGRCFTIYRMKTSGKSQKKLASGSHPIVQGKYIYFFKLKKVKRYGSYVDDCVIGLYRMKLNGKEQKKLVSFPKSAYAGAVSSLSFSGDVIYFKFNNKAYVYDLTTGKKSRYRGSYISNIGSWHWESGEIDDAALGDYTYVPRGDELVVSVNDAEEKSIQFPGDIRKVIASGAHLMVIAHYPYDEYNSGYGVYMMDRDGANRKKVRKGVVVSGGEDYE